MDRISEIILSEGRLVGTKISSLISGRLLNVLGEDISKDVEKGKINIDKILENDKIEEMVETVAQAVCQRLTQIKFFQRIVEFQTKDITSNEGHYNLLKSFLFKVALKVNEMGEESGLKIKCGIKDIGTYFETFLIYEDNVHNNLEMKKINLLPILLDK